MNRNWKEIRATWSVLGCSPPLLDDVIKLLHSNEENRERWKYSWNVCFDQSRARPCNRRKRMGFSVTESSWFWNCFERPQDLIFIFILQELKLLFLSICEPHALRKRKYVWALLENKIFRHGGPTISGSDISNKSNSSGSYFTLM